VIFGNKAIRDLGERRLFRRIVSGIMLMLLLIGMLMLAFNVQPVRSEPTTWIVDDDGPADFHTIQEAINAANPGDTIYVKAGTYYENVVVKKSISLIGENRETTIIDGSPITPELDYIIMFLKDVENVYISGFTLRNGPCGIELDHSYNCIITNNIITMNYAGGITLFNSNFNDLTGNLIISNEADGIGIIWSNNNSIVQNTIRNNTCGLQLQDAHDNVICHNSFVDNLYCQAISTQGSVNVWDDGYPSGGNYWSDYTGVDLFSGPYQNETGSDGIGDAPYVIDENNTDRYPLMNLWGTGTPVAGFTWTPLIPKIGESVTFDASSSTPIGGTIVRYEWDFGDGEYATGRVVTHTYTNPDTYTVTLNVTDSEGLWDIEQKQIQVVQPYGPKAEFVATPDTALVGESVEFDASASLPGWNGTYEMPIIEYCWDFGDGNRTTTSTAIVYHSFSSSGIYYVTLTVYAPGATPETDSITHKVTVITMPVGGYSLPIKGYKLTRSLTLYLALLVILTTVFTAIKRKTYRRTKQR